jgi:hypothetical protein
MGAIPDVSQGVRTLGNLHEKVYVFDAVAAAIRIVKFEMLRQRLRVRYPLLTSGDNL